MNLSSPAFEDGGKIPEKHGYTRENTNPPLKFSDISRGAESLVLVMDDPDAEEPAGKIWDHWLVWNISPETKKIEEGSTPDEAVEGVTDFRKAKYGGPNPPDGTHTYRFRLFALDKQLEIDEGSDKEELMKAVESHILEKATLEGKFDPIN